jgi:hypothetical protein
VAAVAAFEAQRAPASVAERTRGFVANWNRTHVA